MMKRGFNIPALLASTCIAFVPESVAAQSAPVAPDEPQQETMPEAPPQPAADGPTQPLTVETADADAPRAQADATGTPRPSAVADQSRMPAEAAPKAQGETAAAASPRKRSDSLERAGYIPGYRGYVGVGATPFIPRVGSLPGGMTPAFGAPTPPDDWSFNFTGFMSASLRASINTRANPRDGQSTTVLHAAPQTVDVYGSFNDTGATPGNWVGLQFQYGNRYVTANVSFDTYNPTRATNYTTIGSQYFINDTFLSIRVPPLDRLRMAWNVGFFSQPYGNLGQYGGGLYNAPLVGNVSGAGETLTAEYALNDTLTLIVEDGISGNPKSGKVPHGVVNNASTSFSDFNVSPSFVHQAHVGLRKRGETTIQVMGHFMTNWTQSDQLEPAIYDNVDTRQWDERDPQDGHFHVAGVDLRAISPTYGYLGLGAVYITAEDAYRLRGISTYAQDGVRLTEDWFGASTGGTGSLAAAGVNYKFSLGSILRAPAPFWGDGPDLVFEVAAQVARTSSRDADFDGRLRNKFGADVLYTFLPWIGVGLRADRIAPNSKEPEETFYALAPRLQFRSNWQSHETITLKYSKWFYGDKTHADGWDARPREQLDDQMIGLGFGMWW
jgi:hypothetical protein